MNFVRCLLAGSLCGAVIFVAARLPAAEQLLLDVTVTVDLSDDVGQNRGSLFEAYDDQGNVVAGAGFLGAYNTQPRSNRRRLHFFLKPKQVEYSSDVLPRVNSHTGVYLSDQTTGEHSNSKSTLLARTRNGRDPAFYALDPSTSKWMVDESVTGYDIDVAGKPLRIRDKTVVYDHRTILTVGDDVRICENYYANGSLVLRLQNLHESDRSNRLIAIPWTSDADVAEYDPAANPTLQLRSHREFAYAIGQFDEQVLVATNTGGVYSLSNAAWRVVVEPGPHSYQVYAMMNYYDRLLLGHYPSGELHEYDGHELRRLSQWPPVMPGVSPHAREAQTLAVYGGDLYVGVWPWGEVWRYDRNSSKWQLVRRMFTHPEPTDLTTHPYENETAAESKVRNLWGQRVTSMVPLDESLYISTSSKGGTEVVPKFLLPSKWQDYGRVYRLRMPGQLSAEIDWTQQPTTLRCRLTNRRMSLWQDGTLKAEQSLNTSDILGSMPDRISWGRGVYGRFRGDLISRHSNFDQPFLGAYVNFGQIFEGARTITEQQTAIGRMLDRFQASELRVVMPYVTTTSGRAAFPSSIIANHLYDGWDPLAYLISGAQKRQLQVYPVFCVLASGHTKPDGILKTHPDWAIRSLDGEPIGYISPANANARAWVTSVIQEVVGNYDIDGILLDYLRYHNRPTRLDALSEAEFMCFAKTRSDLPEAEQLQSFREAGLTSLARQISVSARAIRPGLKIALYSWGPHVASDHLVGQAWPEWSQEGYIDMVNISGYCYRDNYGEKYLDVFSRRIGDAVRLNRDRHGRADITFCLGVATSHGKIHKASHVNDYLVRGVAEQVSGVAIFTWSTLTPFLEDVNRSEFFHTFDNQVKDRTVNRSMR